MRLNITSQRAYMLDFLVFFFEKSLEGRLIEAYVNGTIYKGELQSGTNIDKEGNYYALHLTIDKTTVKIPVLLEISKVRIIRGNLVFLETEEHTTRIEAMDK